MDKTYRTCVLEDLKKRNDKEHSFKEIIKYSRKLLEKLDYAEKENAIKNFPAIISEQASLNTPESLRSGDHATRTHYEILQKEILQNHSKISGLAEQVINLKDALDAANVLLVKRTTELVTVQEEFKHTHELCKALQSDVSSLKRHLQNKADEYDALNITYSSIENQRNDLEIENRRLKNQLSILSSVKEKSSSSESFEKSFESVSSHASVSSNKSLTITERRRSTSNPKLAPIKSPSPKLIHVKPSSPKLVKTKSESDSLCPNVVLPEKVKYSISAHDSEVTSVLWFPTASKESSFLVTAGADRRLRVWEMNDTDIKLMKSARDCNSSIMSIDIDSEAGLVLCASGDFASRVWTIADFTLRHTLTGHSGKVMAAKFINENCKIVTGSADQTLKLWDFPQKICTMTYATQSPVNDVISRNPSSIISAHCDNKVRFWDTRAKTEVATIETDGIVTSLDLSKRTGSILISEIHNKMKVFDIRTCKTVQTLSAKNFEIFCNWTRAKFSPDGKYCACGSKNGSVFVWNLSSGLLERELKYHNSSVIACSWSTCGSYLASCGKDKNCIVWSKCK